MQILQLVVSPVHRYDGRPATGPKPFEGSETVHEAKVRAHLGLVGDRYFGTKHTFASVTFLSDDELQDTARGLGAPTPFDPVLARRNVVLSGVDVEDLARTTFSVDSGHGPIRFRSRTRANPCAWMDVVFAPGAHQALRGHAGIRAEPLDDGVLTVGPATVHIVERHGWATD